MRRSYKITVFIIGILVPIGLAIFYFWHHHPVLLSPRGYIAKQERNLIVFSALLSLVVVIPVFVMTAVIAWRYRESNHKVKYQPDWDHSAAIETTWWLIPTILIFILSVVTWQSSHQLDPFKPLSSSASPLTVQVVALQWKWLFIYPQQNIASVNYLVIPEKTPINLEVTADAPMNSLWIPELSGQIYAMSGMATQLHIIADKTGTYTGRSANISGEGFANMQFKVSSDSKLAFDNWVGFVRKASGHLDAGSYAQLAKPSLSYPVTYYSSTENYLYDKIVFRTMPDTTVANASL